MAKYIIKRLIFIIPIMIGVSIIVFFLLSLSPGDPASLVLGANASQEDLELFREQNGLNKPLPEQYLDYMSGIIRGDLGKSYATRQNVSDMISIRIWDTLLLCLGADLFMAVFGTLIGIVLALRQNSIFDNIMRVLMIFFAAMPQFWLGMMMILLFSVELGWLPSSGFNTFSAMIMPFICLAMSGSTFISRTARASMLEVINQDYIRTARAKGLDSAYIIRKHAIKNGLLPIITVIGRYVSASIAGAVVIETVFNINGLGKMMVDALRQKDIPTIMSCVLISALFVSLVNLITDIAYTYIDPRLKTKYIGKKKIEVQGEKAHG